MNTAAQQAIDFDAQVKAARAVLAERRAQRMLRDFLRSPRPANVIDFAAYRRRSPLLQVGGAL